MTISHAMGPLLINTVSPARPLSISPLARFFFNAMITPDGGITKKHLIFSLNIDTGTSIPAGLWMWAGSRYSMARLLRRRNKLSGPRSASWITFFTWDMEVGWIADPTMAGW